MFHKTSISDLYELKKQTIYKEVHSLSESRDSFDVDREYHRLQAKFSYSPIELLEDQIHLLPMEAAHRDIPDGFGDGDYVRQHYIKVTVCVPYSPNANAKEIHDCRGSTFGLSASARYDINTRKNRFEIELQLSDESKAKEAAARAIADLKAEVEVKNRDIQEGNARISSLLKSSLEEQRKRHEEGQKKMNAIAQDLGFPVKDD